MARIKLLTPWIGDLPDWLPLFRERMSQNTLVDHEVIALHTPTALSAVAELVSGVPCRKATPYATCDYRPLFGKMFVDKIRDYQWWGWCDLDICVGDLDGLLEPMLDCYDIISGDPKVVAGPFTILRNTQETRTLYERSHYALVLADPAYRNYDESGFNDEDLSINTNFTKVVNESGLRIRYDSRKWAENQDPLERGIPSRCCTLEGKRLLEVPTRNDLLYYHFTSKKWPLPNRYEDYRGKQIDHLQRRPPEFRHTREIVPGESPEFWDARVIRVLALRQPYHVCSYDTSKDNWDRIQDHTARVLRKEVPPGSSLLDAGCGCGALLECVKGIAHEVKYTGVDYSRAMIGLGRLLHPRHRFVESDLRSLPFRDKQFEVCICRGVEGSVRSMVGNDAWNDCQREMLRVASRLLVINLDCECKVIENP